MAELEKTLANLPAAIEKLQISNEKAEADALKATQEEGDKLRAAVTESNQSSQEDFDAAITALKIFEKNQKVDTQLSKEQAAATEAYRQTSAGQAEALKKSMEDQGRVAEDSKEYTKLNYQAKREEINDRLKNPDLSKAARKELEQERESLDKKNQGLLGEIAGGVTGMFDKMTQPVAAAKKGFMTMLKGTLVAGVLMAVVAFLQSDMWKKLKVIIIEKAAPLLKDFVKYLGDNWEEIAAFIGGILAAFVVFKAIMIGAKIVKTIQLIGVAFTAVKAFFASTMLPAITSMMVPLLPFIAIAVAIGVVLYALWNAFEDFCKTLNETGSIGEALKVGIAKFMGTILGFIPMLILKLVGWVAGLFGFDDFKAKVDAIDPIQWISDTIKGLFDKLFAWFGLLFKDPVKALKKLVKGFFGGFLNIADWLVDMIKKPLVWLLGLFGWDDAAAAVETFSLKGFVMETWNKVKCWFTNLFSWAAKEDSGDSWLIKTVKGVITGVKEWFGKMFDFGTLKSSLASVINIVLWLPNLVKDAVASVTAWLLGLFGFDDAAKAVSNASKWTIGGLIMGVVDSVVKWLKGLFSWGEDKGTTAAGDFSLWKMITGIFGDIKDWFIGLFKWGEDKGTTAAGDFSLWIMITGIFGDIKDWFVDLFSWGSADEATSGDFSLWTMITRVFKSIKKWFSGLWSWGEGVGKKIAGTFSGLGGMIGDIFKKVKGWFLGIFGFGTDKDGKNKPINVEGAKGFSLSTLVGNVWKKIKEFFWHPDGKSGMLQFDLAGSLPSFEMPDFGKMMASVVKSVFPKSLLDKTILGYGIKDFLPDSLVKLLSEPDVNRAGGGPFSKGQSMLVGEMGPEMIIPNGSGTVMNANRTKTMTESALQKSVGSQNGGGTTVIDSSQKIVNANKTGVQNFGTPLKNTNLAGTLAAA